LGDTQVLLWHWFAFSGLVVFLLVLDLKVFHKTDHEPSLKESTWFTIFWIAVGLAFNVLIWVWAGHEAGVKFLTGYVVEKALSMDNIFVFVMIFHFFHVPLKYQYRVLFWGILGAVVMRLLFILIGVELFHRFAWVMPLFGLLLIFSAYKLIIHSGAEIHPEKNIVLKTARRFFRVTEGDHHEHGNAFFVRQNGLLYITPMFLVLLVIESSDVIFAIDSVPAIIGVTSDRFLAFTSNVFAILGLRALYFLLAGIIDMFKYLHYGLAAVLGFIGIKMIGDYIGAEYYGHEEHLITPWMSLIIIAVILGSSIAASILIASREEPTEE
jgi:tellurite resistance protein TerC